MHPYLTAETARLRHEEILRDAARHAPRSGRRRPRDPRPARGRHR
jgi:hypothetical protein